jgi:hypothetical protein
MKQDNLGRKIVAPVAAGSAKPVKKLHLRRIKELKQ